MRRCIVVSVGLFLLGLFLSPALSQNTGGKRYALLVGVREYAHTKLPSLRYSENDVVELATVLQPAGYSVILLCDSVGKQAPDRAPTRSNIEAHLKAILEKCKPGDTIVIAFAGHGVQFEGQKDAYFCPADARPFADETATLVSLKAVYDRMERSFAGVKVLLVDACRDDPGANRGVRGINADTAPRPPEGVAALFSCRAGERAFEHEKYKHGVFFYHLLKGLRGEAKNSRGSVTFGSLVEYVQDAVSHDVPKLIGAGAKQSPNMKADLSGTSLVLLPQEASSAGLPAVQKARLLDHVFDRKAGKVLLRDEFDDPAASGFGWVDGPQFRDGRIICRGSAGSWGTYDHVWNSDLVFEVVGRANKGGKWGLTVLRHAENDPRSGRGNEFLLDDQGRLHIVPVAGVRHRTMSSGRGHSRCRPLPPPTASVR
jgi:Caspase domain